MAICLVAFLVVNWTLVFLSGCSVASNKVVTSLWLCVSVAHSYCHLESCFKTKKLVPRISAFLEGIVFSWAEEVREGEAAPSF